MPPVARDISSPAGRSKQQYLTRPMSTIRVSVRNYRCSNAGAHVRTGSALYIEGDSHFFASSQQDSTCAVVPGTPEDVGKIVRSFPSIPPNITPYLRKRTTSFDNQLKVIDATKTPFSVSHHWSRAQDIYLILPPVC